MNKLTMNNKLLALAYMRYSSHNQDDSNSIASQTTTIENYAQGNNMEIEKYYIDMAKSGRNQNRPEFQRLKNDIETKQVKAKIIIVRSIDRMNRNTKNQLNDLEWFSKHNIRLIFVTDGIDTASTTNKLITTLKAAVAEDFSDTLSKNTRAAMLESAKQCRHLGGIPPIGYRVNDVGLYEIDELNEPIVRDIFSLYLQDMGYSYIIKHLKNKGYKTSNGKDFNKSSINAILKNKKYMGTYVYDKSMSKDSEGKRNSHKYKEEFIEIPNGMPAIVSEEDFKKVQEKMAGNAQTHSIRTSKNYYALNGKLHCSKCGKAFTGNVNHSNGIKYYQYRSSCDCKTKSVNTGKLNDFAFYALQQCIFSPENKEKMIEIVNRKLSNKRTFQSAEINELQNKINGIENAQNNLMDYLEAGKGSSTILNKIQKNEEELAVLKTQLDIKSKEIGSVDDDTYNRLVNRFMDYMSTTQSSGTKKLRDAAFKAITIGDDKISIYFNRGVSVDNDTLQYFNECKED